MTDLERPREPGGTGWLPVCPGLAPFVRARLAEEGPGGVRSRRRVRPGRRVVAALGAAAVAATLVLWTPARQAVADLFGLSGVRFSQEVPPPVPLGGLRLGDRTDLDDARRRAGFPLRTASGLASPDVYVDADGSASTVSLVYPPHAGVPRIEPTGIGVLLSQFRGRLEKPRLTKFIGDGTRLRAVSVQGHRGYWIDGLPHVVLYQDAEGRIQEDGARLAGSVLLWEVDGIILRLESGLSMERALAMAATVG